MKFIEVKPGLSVRIDTIAMFRDSEEGGTTVLLNNGNTYHSQLSYFDFAMHIGRSEQANMPSQMEKDIHTLMKTSQML